MTDMETGMRITEEMVFSLLPPRRSDSHKGDYGTLLALCGSRCYRGAAILSCGGALRSGAGIVCLGSVEEVVSAAVVSHPELTLLPLPADAEGGIDTERCAGQILGRLERSDACLAGCGMGNTPATASLTRMLLGEARCPLVLDADALNALSRMSDRDELLRLRSCPTVLTPHVGEMARLSGERIADIKASPAAIAARYAEKWGCTLVLKDAVTHIADASGRVWRGEVGNAGMARGGSGDVLAGIIASLLAQGRDASDAAVCGVYLHGAAGDECASRLSMSGMLPSDLLGGLCAVFARNQR